MQKNIQTLNELCTPVLPTQATSEYFSSSLGMTYILTRLLDLSRGSTQYKNKMCLSKTSLKYRQSLTYDGLTYVLDFAMVQKRCPWIFSGARIQCNTLS